MESTTVQTGDPSALCDEMLDNTPLCLDSPHMFDVAGVPEPSRMEGYHLFQDALIMPFDLAENISSYSYLVSEHDDVTTPSTASSPLTPSSDNSSVFPGWSLLSQEPGLDLSSWDATPDWVKQRSPQLYDLDDSLASHKKACYMDDPHDLLVSAAEPAEEASKDAKTPFRFVEITPDKILSGEIHRAKGEWKRGRPRLRKSAPKSKSKVTPARHEANLFQPVFDHLLVTEQEKGFFAGLFAPSLFG
ncbi:hypothetical protein LTR10_011525 [Elasticomyces elasticus]|nr:hypothetical protein LTR10_011525 [Elasticomyces elasticus]KAK5032017.1 hypothetical protein LTS07_004639 [Exophiala sideris]KAK5040946.1 hypothetical protein LTR13_003248 [Exophiala sideris]KAK5184420.1 hypothetical protein LTR44_003093 [Eurotiomycetes sp. CCFEE 6388]